MYWVNLEGEVLPKLVSGHPALDLCNTYAGWGGPPHPKADWLRSPVTFVVWSWHAGVLEPEEMAELRALAEDEPGGARRMLTRVRRFRSDLYSVLTEGDTSAFSHVAATAQRAARTARLEPTATGGARWALPAEVGLDVPLLRLARQAADLLVGSDHEHVGVCPGDECGWLFLDPRGRRRWCSMQTCGNRSKVKAFADRRRAEQD